MRLDEATTKSFARHETFHPRFGWAKKAVDGASSSEDLFNLDEAVVELGVGKNMVRSIRFWGLAYKLLETVKVFGDRMSLVKPSPIGLMLLSDAGLDPYAERPGTAWLLHWLLLAPPSYVPTWWIAFHEFPQLEFDEAQLVDFVVERTELWAPQANSIRKDVNCLVRMYVGGGGGRQTFDDLIDCPSRELDLITGALEKGRFRFVLGEKSNLPPEIAAFCCLDFMVRTGMGSTTSTLSRLVVEPGSPGKAFRLTESNLLELLQLVVGHIDGLALGAAAGAPQLIVNSPIEEVAEALLSRYYKKSPLKGVPYLGWSVSEVGIEHGEE